MQIRREIEDKAYTAETHVAAVRLAIIVLNIGVFLFLLPPAQTIPWLGYTISVVALAYALVVVLLRPQERFPVMGSSRFTSVTDGVLITLWILATGGFASPFYVLWYASIAAIALRYDARTTLLTALAYVVLYTLLLGSLGALRVDHLSALVVRNAYTLFIGVLGAWLAHESLAQRRARTEVAQMAERLDGEVRSQTRALLEREQELKTSLEDLETANRRLTELDRLKTAFINTTAHELRTPLTALKLQLHLLKTAKMGDLNPRQQRATEILDRNMQRLALLITDVGDAAKLQSGHFRITPEPVSLVPILREVYETVHEAARQRDIDITLTTPEHLPLVADADRLIQVVFNLMTNALKFTPDHGHIAITAWDDDKEIHVTVSDDGAGMGRGQIDRLFQPFSQVHDTMESAGSGTGLGLYISKGIIEHHGGSIWCESDGPGHGTTFHFTVPRSIPRGHGQNALHLDETPQAVHTEGMDKTPGPPAAL